MRYADKFGGRSLRALTFEAFSVARIAPEHFRNFQTLEYFPAVAAIQSVEYLDDTPDLPPV